MKVDVPLFTLILSASAAAQPASYNATRNSTSWSNDDGKKQISELEKEIQSLRQQLQAASHPTCETPSSSSPSSSSGPVVPGSYGSSAPAAGYSSVNHAVSSAAPGYGAGASGAATQPQGYPSEATQYSTAVATITRTDSVVVSTIVVTDTVQPVAASSAAAGVSSPAAGYSSPAAPVSWAASSASSLPSNPDYYAPHPPSSLSSDVPTHTVIVTPGQSAPTNAAGSNALHSGSAHTCTETYLGSKPVPSPPSSSANATTTIPVVTLPISSSGVTSTRGAGSAPIYGYPNGTASAHYPYGSSAGASGSGVSSFYTRVASSSATSSLASASSFLPTVSANSSSTLPGTATSTSSTASASATALTGCAKFCSELTTFNDWDVTPLTCTQLTAGTTVNTPSGQSSVGCAASFTPSIDICQVTLNVKTSGTAQTYMEVWLPNGNGSSSSWNGRSMSTDNGGLNGCVHYVDMQYVSGLGFASIGDNAGHNGSSFDGTWTMHNNEAIIDWSYRARHASVDVGKQVIDAFYNKKPDYSYYIGCSAGGAQGLQSAQMFPNDFDGIISGAAAADFNHLQSWSAHFRTITGTLGNDTFLNATDLTTVQTYILEQCDEKLDGVKDGILEDPTICNFDASAIPVCSASVTSGCLHPTQIETVKEIFKPLYNDAGKLIYPALLYGAQVDAFRLGLLSGSIQGIAQDFFRGGVFNSSTFDITKITPADYDRIDALDELHGKPSAFNGDLSGFSEAGKKLIMYHGMADPMTSGLNSERYYQKVAKTMGVDNNAMDDFLRLFRISGMAHCGVGGISGAGAWMFGQSGAAAPASNNIVRNLVDWVEKGDAPDTILGTKFWYDTPSLGIEFERPHCKFPFRTTYKGGDSTKPASWGCTYIEDWQKCEGVTCDADGTFT